MISRGGLFCALVLSACSTPTFGVEGPPKVSACADQTANGKACGGDCPLCGLGDPCQISADCSSGDCGDGSCVMTPGTVPDPTCADHLLNGKESDVDCGGTCPSCAVDQHCSAGSDCVTLSCSTVCQPASCTDHVRNGSESAIDCGGACMGCGLGASCHANADCTSGSCSVGLCVAASCDDQLKNGTETDTDCGGSCAACQVGLSCAVGADCATLSCSAAKQCAKATCTDNLKNGLETDTDCGAGCKACSDGAHCNASTDCSSALCKGSYCVPKAASGGALLRVGWTATASNSTGNSTPADALDGNTSSRWSSGALQAPGMSYTLDMQSPQLFFGLTLDSTDTPGDAPVLFDVYLSQDGTFPTPPGPVLKGQMGAGLTTVTFGSAQVARYIKLVLTQSKPAWWGIRELNVTN